MGWRALGGVQVSHLVDDDDLLDDMARALTALVVWLTEVGFDHEGMNIDALHDLLTRYRVERE